MRASRRECLAGGLSAWGLTLPDDAGALIDPAAWFPGRKIWLEIGFGAGEHIAGQAQAHPEIGFLGCEPFVNGVAALMARLREAGTGNVRVFPDDAHLLLQRLPAACVDRVFVLFPDPWPKHRHRRRRLLSPASLTVLAKVLRPGGELWFASDDAALAVSVLAMLTARDDYRWLASRAEDWRLPPAGWIGTRYEAKALARGAAPIYLRFARCDQAENARSL